MEKWLKSILAGIVIGLGGWMYLLAPTPIVGAFIFACGLLCVRIYGLNLFTGKIQYMVTKKYKFTDYFIFLVGNLIGVCIITAISYATLNNTNITFLANSKATQPFYLAIIKGFGCGALMSIATYKETPLWVCIPCVMGFILAGFNHCIADAYYALSGGFISTAFIGTIIGNVLGGIALSNLNRDEQ